MFRFKIHLLSLLAVCFGGCDGTDLQDQFARDAGRTPQGYTATDRNGAVSDDDPDDWRISPFFAGKVRVDPAFPNPTTGESVTITVTTFYSDVAPGGVNIQTRGNNGRFLILDSEPGVGVSTYLLSFSPATLARSGLVRVLVFDTGGEIISYGDVLIN